MRHWLIVLIFCWSGHADARWLKAETASFRIYGEGSEADLRQRAVRLEDYVSLLHFVTGTKRQDFPAKLDLYLLRNSDQLRIIQPALRRGVAGFYRASPYGLSAFAVAGAYDVSDDAGMFVIQHEVAHHFMFALGHTSYPAWYAEGFADYMAQTDIQPDRIIIGDVQPARAIALLRGDWLPFQAVLNGTTGDFKSSGLSMFYAESWLATHYIFNDAQRLAAFRVYLDGVASGVSADQAFAPAFKTDYSSFQSQMRAYMRSDRMTRTVLKRGASEQVVPVQIATLPPSADKMLLMWAKLRAGGQGKLLRDEFLAQVRTDAALYPGDSLAMLVLGYAESVFGDRGAGARTLDALLAKDPDNAEILYLRGLNESLSVSKDAPDEAERVASARRYFTSAYKADPTHFPTLFRYAMLQEGGGHGNDNSLYALLKAARVAPQVSSIVIAAARALMERKRYPEAIPLLTQIVNSPHNRGDEAKRLLEAARQGLPPPRSEVE